ncbi:hypothetical protein AVEN_16441-1, partial [Araneus ventricosus]
MPSRLITLGINQFKEPGKNKNWIVDSEDSTDMDSTRTLH